MPVPIGINSADPRDFSTGGWIYSNFCKVARTWIGATTIKGDGYPIAAGADQAISYVGWDVGEFLPTGTWLFDIASTAGTTVTLVGQTFGTYGVYGSGSHEIVRGANDGGFQLIVEDGEVNFLALWAPNHHQSTNLLRNEAITRINQFACFRTMDLQRINNSDSTGNLHSNAAFNDFTYEGGVRKEVLAAIGNELDIPLWLCFHHLWDNNEVSGFVGYLAANLIIPPYFEYSNEVWNPPFTQHAYAKTIWAATPTHPASPAVLGSAETAYWGHGYRTVETMKIVKNLWPQAKTVLGSQNVNSSPSFGVAARSFSGGLQQIADFPSEEQDISLIIDHLAVAPYFGNGTIPDGQDLFNWCTTDAPDNMTAVLNKIADHNTLVANKSNANNITVIGYEGGQHLIKPTANAELLAFNNGPQMGQLYDTYLPGWETAVGAGSGIMVLYNLAGEGDSNGYWGLSQSIEATSYKYDSTINYIGSVAPPDPIVLSSGSFFSGYSDIEGLNLFSIFNRPSGGTLLSWTSSADVNVNTNLEPTVTVNGSPVSLNVTQNTNRVSISGDGKLIVNLLLNSPITDAGHTVNVTASTGWFADSSGNYSLAFNNSFTNNFVAPDPEPELVSSGLYLTRYSSTIFGNYNTSIQKIHVPSDQINPEDDINQTLETRERIASSSFKVNQVNSTTGTVLTDHRMNIELPEDYSYVKYKTQSSMGNINI